MLTDPAGAVTVADSIENESLKADTLRDVAIEWAKSEPEKAATLAGKITPANIRGFALQKVASIMASNQPEQAATLALTLEKGSFRVRASASCSIYGGGS